MAFLTRYKNQYQIPYTEQGNRDLETETRKQWNVTVPFYQAVVIIKC